MTEYSERELVLPALDIINQKPGISTAELIVELENVLAPDGEDLDILAGRSDTKFSQKVRNLVSHHTIDQKGLGYIQSIQQGRNWYHTITSTGLEYLEKYLPDEVEGAETGINLPDENPEASPVTGEYPVDSILIRNEQRSVFEIMRRIKAGKYILDPDFQRDFVWPEVKQSRLIESALMRIPLPVFYLAEREDGKIVVVDGLQRLRTFENYIDNKFALQLPKLSEAKLPETSQGIRGNKFSELSLRLQQRIEDTQLIVYLIDPKVPEKVRLDIFERVNSGIPLSRQQMRNAIYMGPATKWLKEEAKSEEFLRATGYSLNRKTMRDREFINRYCAFTLSSNIDNDYQGDLDDFLARTLEHMNRMDSDHLKEMSIKFRRSMINNYMVFERNAFRRHSPGDTSRRVINMALFDVFSVLIARFESEYVQEYADEMHKRFYVLMENTEFVSSISTSINSLSTNSVTKVRTRFKLVLEAFKDL